MSMEESSWLRSSPHLTGTMGGRGWTRRSSREGDGGRGGGEDAMIVIAGPGGETVSIARCPVLKYGLLALTPYKSDKAMHTPPLPNEKKK